MLNDPKDFKIPSEFILFGHKYTVVIEDDLFEKEDCYGQADDDAKKIRLQRKSVVTRSYEDTDDKTQKETLVDINDGIVLETFYHELYHIIFDALGETEMSQNEKLVNMLGKAMLEIYLSSAYEEKAK